MFHTRVYSQNKYIHTSSVSSLQTQKKVHLSKVPDPLKPWVIWANRDLDFTKCPLKSGGNPLKFSDHLCQWPGVLSLDIQKNTGWFSQQWKTYQDGWIILPGNENLWPVSVKANGRDFPVVKKNNLPAVFLKKGEWFITGQWTWQTTPQTISVPPLTHLINATFNQSLIEYPKIKNHQLWLGKEENTKASDTVSLEVFRLISDGQPIIDETLVRLTVSGRVRNILLGKALLNQFSLIETQSELPAWVNPDGELFVQARPGRWDIRIKSHAIANLKTLSVEASPSVWPKNEIWSYQRDDNIRNTRLEGGSLVDPQTVNVPEAWLNFPSYRVEVSENIQLNEKFRGIPNNELNRFHLKRHLWLTFDNNQWQFDDHIHGDMRQQWRLDMQHPYSLRYASENKKPLLITTQDANLSKTKVTSGIEVRSPTLNVSAGGNLAHSPNLFGKIAFDNMGWNINFEKTSLILNLPPAHRLMHTAHVENAPGAWTKQWTIWTIFLILLMSSIAYRAFGLTTALLTFFTFVFLFHENQAPLLSLINLIIAFSVFRYITSSHIIIRYLRNGYLILSCLIAVGFIGSFTITQTRLILHPQLENYQVSRYSLSNTLQENIRYKQRIEQDAISDELDSNLSVTLSRESSVKKERIKKTTSTQNYQKDIVAQIGQGKPDWRWNQYRLNWNHPITSEQGFSLWILTPWMTGLWRGLGILLMMLLLFNLWRINKQRYSLFSFTKPIEQATSSVAIILVSGLVLSLSSPSSEAKSSVETPSVIPDKTLLKELQEWTNPAPFCSPHCASIDSVEISTDNNQLTLQLNIYALASTAIRLPKSQQWKVQKQTLNGTLYPWSIEQNHQSWIFLKSGYHQLLLTGSIPPMHQLNFHFPDGARRILFHSQDWDIAGIHHQQLKGKDIELLRKANTHEQKTEDNIHKVNPNEEIKPLLKLIRELHFDGQWIMHNRVERIAPVKGTINLLVPLYTWEHPLHSDLNITDNQHLQLHLSAKQSHLSWRSKMDNLPDITLTALENKHFVEEWIIHHSHQWHLDIQGLPWHLPKPFLSDTSWRYRFLPRPNERLVLTLSDPKAIDGHYQSFDNLELEVNSGKQQSNITLSATYRSSRGGQGKIHIGEGQQLTGSIDHKETLLRIQDGFADYPILPGTHSIDFNWKHNHQLSWKTQLPIIDLNAPVGNISLKWSVPRDRWVVWTQGPTIGPAVVYWGELAAFLLFALILWRLKTLPISTGSWLLLGFGLSTQSWPVFVFFTLVLLLLQWRKTHFKNLSDNIANLLQICIILFSSIGFLSLILAVPWSLFNQPDMGIAGNNSNAYFLNWYYDATQGQTPEVIIYSLPIWIYQLIMLVWALWLAFALTHWLKWGWQCIHETGFWRKSSVIIQQSPQKQTPDAVEKQPPE